MSDIKYYIQLATVVVATCRGYVTTVDPVDIYVS